MPNARKRFRPTVERLESRLPLAGNVTAVQIGSELLLTGDEVNNRLWIVGNGAGNFAVQAIGAQLNGVDAATINFNGVTKIRLSMGNGNDTVSFIRSHLEGSLKFWGGDGDDLLFFGQGNHENQRFGQITASLGAGQDTISASGENSLTVDQSFVVIGGDGNNAIDLQTDARVSLGSVVIVGGLDNDVATFSKGLIDTKSIRFHGSSGYNSLQLLGDSSIHGNVIATGGGQQDIFTMGLYANANSTISGSVLLMHGEGSNDVAFRGSTHLAGPIRYEAGAGDDEFVSYDNFLVPQSNQFVAGDIDLRLGDGANFVRFDQSHSDLQRVSVLTGAGADHVAFFDANIHGETLLNAGDGDNRLVVINSAVFARMSWTSGNGADRISLESGYVPDDRSLFFHAEFIARLGNGNDTMYIGESDPDVAGFVSAVLLDGGLGDDLLVDFNADYAVPPMIVGFE